MKSKKASRITRYFHYLDVELPDDVTVIYQRSEADIWQKLFEFPMLETMSEEMPDGDLLSQRLNRIFDTDIPDTYTLIKISTSNQLLTHRKITGIFYKVKLGKSFEKINKEHYLVER